MTAAAPVAVPCGVRVAVAMRRRAPLPPKVLSATSMVGSSAPTSRGDRLVHRNLAACQVDRGNRRRLLVTLTDAGKEVVRVPSSFRSTKRGFRSFAGHCRDRRAPRENPQNRTPRIRNVKFLTARLLGDPTQDIARQSRETYGTLQESRGLGGHLDGTPGDTISSARPRPISAGDAYGQAHLCAHRAFACPQLTG